VSLAIQEARSLTFGMRPDKQLEKFFSEHATLGEKITQVDIEAYKDTRQQNSFGYPRPDHSLDIWDVTVVPSIHTVENITWIVLYYSGATKEWFRGGGCRSAVDGSGSRSRPDVRVDREPFADPTRAERRTVPAARTRHARTRNRRRLQSRGGTSRMAASRFRWGRFADRLGQVGEETSAWVATRAPKVA
jgi:hypothetical protein